MNNKTENADAQLLGLGFILAFIKCILMFFSSHFMVDIVIFLTAGWVLGKKVPANRMLSGLILAMPAVVLCLLFVFKNGYASIRNGIGTAFFISLFTIPAATMLGVILRAKLTVKAS